MANGVELLRVEVAALKDKVDELMRTLSPSKHGQPKPTFGEREAVRLKRLEAFYRHILHASKADKTTLMRVALRELNQLQTPDEAEHGTP